MEDRIEGGLIVSWVVTCSVKEEQPKSSGRGGCKNFKMATVHAYEYHIRNFYVFMLSNYNTIGVSLVRMSSSQCPRMVKKR